MFALSEPGLCRHRQMRATLRTKDFMGTVDFCELPSVHFMTFDALGEMLKGLARDWRGWDGERVWVAEDGEFTMICTHDGVGQVRIRIVMVPLSGEWRIDNAVVLVEPGQLGRLAEEVGHFMNTLPPQAN